MHPRNTFRDIVDSTSESVATLDENGGVHLTALELRNGRWRYADDKTPLRMRHPPVNEQLPRPIVTECHIANLFNINCGAYYIIYLPANVNQTTNNDATRDSL